MSYQGDPSEAFLRWCKGNEDAARLIRDMANLARMADDLVDEGDNPQGRISQILELALLNIAGNPFYVRNHATLAGVVVEMLAYWRLGDRFRTTGDERKEMFGFVYRESCDRLPVVVAGIIGGVDHAIAVAEEVYQMMHAGSTETVADWAKE